MQAIAQQKADPVLLHHADWIASLFSDQRDHTDWHNAARLGYDAAAQAYPSWLQHQVGCFILRIAMLLHESLTAVYCMACLPISCNTS